MRVQGSVLDLFQQRVAPFYRDSLTTTTDRTTSLLLQSDRLDRFHNGSPRSIVTDGRRLTGRQTFVLRVRGSSTVRVEERLTDNGVVVVQVFGEPLLGYGLLIELDTSLCGEVVVGLTTSGGELVVLETRLLSGSAHGCCLLHSRKVKRRKKCWKLKMMKRRKVK